MTRHFPLMVPGAAPAAQNATITAPFDGTTIATLEQGDAQTVERAFETAYRLYRDRDGWLKPSRRIEILERAAAIMHDRREELAFEAAREGGKPLVDSLVEADRAVATIRNCAQTLRAQAGSQTPMNVDASSAGRLAFAVHEPIGVVLAFSAFNHPINLIAHQVGPAVAAGCPVIVKPAVATPISCMRVVAILREAGLPEEWCQALLTTGHEVSGQMVSDRRVGFFNFIGSGRVGWMLRGQLAPGAPLALEHGGAAPVIVAADADLTDAVPLLTRGGFYHAGQVCISVQRLFAHRSIARELADALAAAAAALKVGDPTLPDTAVGPLIRPDEVTRVDQWVQEAVGGGAELLCGSETLSTTCYAPTVLFDPPDDTRVSTEEIFGPVVCIYPFNEMNEAISRANALPFSFQAAVMTRDIDIALRAAGRLDAAAVMINDHTAFRVDWMPFGGMRESGMGVGGPPHAIKEMQCEKMIILRSREL